MRILHVLGGLDHGGAETWLIQVLRHIDRSKYQFDFLVHTDKTCAFDSEVRALGARILPCLSPSNPMKYARNFLRVLRETGPYDCVHSHVHHFSGLVLTLARIGGVPARIAHSHSDTRKADCPRGAGRGLYLYSMSKLLNASATAGMAVSDHAAKSLFGEKWDLDPRWRVTRLGIDLNPFSCPVDRSRLLAELGISAGAFVIGHVGRFVPLKNHDLILEIAQIACKIRPETIFLLIGEGPTKKETEDKARALGLQHQIRFLGVRDDVAQLMKGAMDAFLFPSLYEGFPLVLVEAQAAGLRCLISDSISPEVDLVPELIKRLSISDGATAWTRCILDLQTVERIDNPINRLEEHAIDPAIQRLCSVYRNQQESYV